MKDQKGQSCHNSRGHLSHVEVVRFVNYDVVHCNCWLTLGSELITPLSSLRLLEEGKVSEADKKKDEIENKQRDRRLLMTKNGEEHVPRFFK